VTTAPQEFHPSPGERVVLVVDRPWWPSPAAPGNGIVGVVLDDPPSPSMLNPPVPVVGGLTPDLFREGEGIDLDGTRGRVTVTGVRPVEVVTVFVVREDGKLLLLRRSERVGSFRGRWAGVSGYLEDPTPEQQAFREVAEETGIDRPRVLSHRAGRPVYARDGATVYVVHPFLFRVARPDVRLDWEHTECAWVPPEEIDRRPTVPNLDRAWRAVTAPAERKR